MCRFLDPNADLFQQGKCTRAYHVTCAMENTEVDFEEVEVQEWVCKKQKPLEQAASVPATDAVEGKMDVDPAVPQGHLPSTSTEEPNPGPAAEPRSAEEPRLVEEPAKQQYSLVKIVHTKLFCPIHNIVSLDTIYMRVSMLNHRPSSGATGGKAPGVPSVTPRRNPKVAGWASHHRSIQFRTLRVLSSLLVRGG